MIGMHEIHPAAEVFPLLEGSAYDGLCADIKEHGLLHPIVRVWVGHEAALGTRKALIVDGRNRLRACLRVGVAPEFDDDKVSADDDIVAYVVSSNLHRRQLSESQLAIIATKIATLSVGGGGFRGNQYTSGIAPRGAIPLITQAAAASMLNIGRRTVQRARQVLDVAPELVPRIESGELTVMKAARIASEKQGRTPEPTSAERRKLKAANVAVAEPEPDRAVAKRYGDKPSKHKEIAERDEKILELLRDGLAAGEIAKELGVNRHAIDTARQRHGLTKRETNPLTSLNSCAEEFADTWEMALDNNKSMLTATPQQRAELVERLEALVKVTRKLIARLNKEAKESEMAS